MFLYVTMLAPSITFHIYIFKKHANPVSMPEAVCKCSVSKQKLSRCLILVFYLCFFSWQPSKAAALQNLRHGFKLSRISFGRAV